MKKILYLMIVMSLLTALPIPVGFAQEQLVFQEDTVSLGEVTVVPAIPDGTTGYKASYIDKDILGSFSTNTVGAVLNSNTPLYIKSYGAGGTATSSIRGMGASHTQILWEGMRIDNPMTGQTDLSIMLTALIDDITIYSGGTPMGFGNRGPGGTVSVQSKPDWNDNISATYIQNIGSFSNYLETVDLAAGKNNISYRLRAYLQNSENDYEYFDQPGNTDSEILKRIGAAYDARGMLHEINLKNKSTVYGAKIWYNYSDREIPGSIAYPTIEGNEMQTDESIRGIVSLHNYMSKGELEGKIGYTSDWLHYTNESFGIDSRNHVIAINGRLSGIYRFSSGSKLKLGLDLRTTRVNTNNYENPIKRNQAAIELSYSYLFKKRLGFFTSVNQEFMNNEFLRISPSVGIDLSIFTNRDYHLKGSIGLSNHLPTLNDLYWLPGGNPDLKTEKASNYEATFSYKEKILRKLIMEGSITAYRSFIDDMIVWVPVSDYVWSPENIAKVISKGVELDQKFSYSFGKHGIEIIGSYYYTEVNKQNDPSLDENLVGKQLVYVPKNMASLSMIYHFKRLMLTWRSSFTGERFITGDNTASLPSYWLNSASIKNSFNLKSAVLGARISVNNIFNTEYQNVLDYPMPWRSYMLSLSVKFSSQ